MSEAAVIDGGATAPAEAVINPADADRAPTALGSQIPETPAEPKAKSLNDALDGAIAKQAAKAAEPAKTESAKPEVKAEAPKTEPKKAEQQPKPEVKEPPARGEHGHFTAKDKPADAQPQTPAEPAERKPYHEPPSRFLENAKQAWASVPDLVKEETHRAITNLERGVQEHQAYREQFKPYEQLAAKNNTTVTQAMDRYIAMEIGLRKNPVQGFVDIARDIGIDPKKVAAAILNQPAPTQDQSQQTIARLEARLAAAEKQIGGVTTNMQSQQAKAIHTDVETFAAQPGHENFDTLAPFIAGLIQSKPDMTLQEAYDAAEKELRDVAGKLGLTAQPSAPASGAAALTAPSPATAPLNPAGLKSVSGSPATGTSDVPRKKGRLPPISETLDRVMR